LVPALLLPLFTGCTAHVGSITTSDLSVATLEDGRPGAIAFEVLTPRNSRYLCRGNANERSEIAGVLTLPSASTS
jgi:hypothetical protein